VWNSLHNKLFTSRYAPQSANDSALVSAVLLTAAEFDSSPPNTEREALQSLRTVLAGTKALESIERAFSGVIK
jgi:hypothetical protein